MKMTTIEQIDERLNENKKNIKILRAEGKAIQAEKTRAVKKEHYRIKGILQDIALETVLKDENLRKGLFSTITESEGYKKDAKTLLKLLEEKIEKPANSSKADEQSSQPEELDSKTDELSTPPAVSGSETDKQVDRFTGQSRLTGERADASFSY
jgi:hypothetical protein